MKANQQRVLDQLSAMDAGDVADLKFSAAVTKLLQDRAFAYKTRVAKAQTFPLSKATFAPAAKPALTKKATVEQREQRAAAWAKANIKPYNIVRMSGTRDGHGIRLVLTKEGNNVTCYRFKRVTAAEILRYPTGTVVSLKESDGSVGYYAKTKDYSTHQLGKVAVRYVRHAHSTTLEGQDVLTLA